MEYARQIGSKCSTASRLKRSVGGPALVSHDAEIQVGVYAEAVSAAVVPGSLHAADQSRQSTHAILDERPRPRMEGVPGREGHGTDRYGGSAPRRKGQGTAGVRGSPAVPYPPPRT